MVLLIRMVTGSRLTGLSGPHSDTDVIEIHDHIKPQQNKVGDLDITRWPLSMFMKTADKGSHNALEVMFAAPDWPDVDLLSALRASYIANPYLVNLRFSKAAETYLGQGTNKGWLRAQMLLDWSEQVNFSGRFNPRWVDSDRYAEIVSNQKLTQI